LKILRTHKPLLVIVTAGRHLNTLAEMEGDLKCFLFFLSLENDPRGILAILEV